jgi:hypothetical protein
MGLDMYLSARKYVSDFGFKPEDTKLNASIKESLGFGPNEFGHIYVELEVAYWRKANQIHAWFVDNVQDGEDDCGNYYVSREQISELVNLCSEAIDNKDSELLEPKSGFFFGSTDVDEYYWDELKRTKIVLNQILNDKRLEDCAFQYHASW